MGLASPSARLLPPWISLLIRLSWVSPALSLLPINPLSVHSRSVLPPSFGVPAPPAAHHVPPSWILTTSTVCPALGFRAFCSPVRKGFAAFHDTALVLLASWIRRSSLQPVEQLHATPRNAVHTLRSILLASSRSASLRPLPSCRYCPARRGYRPRPVVLADRQSPKREAYTCNSLPKAPDFPCPERRGGR